jgi:anaerobic ribonucleoside-triphosphate reductase activating protein
MEDKGTILDKEILAELLEKYKDAITCVCFMGGDASPAEVESLAAFIREIYSKKTGWYSGKSHVPESCSICHFDYIKLGPYIPHLGGLNSATTNQRFYRIENEKMIDMTNCFYRIENSRVTKSTEI